MLAVYSAAAGIQLTQANNRREETPFPLALWSSFTNMKTVELQPHSIVFTMSSGQTVTTNKERKKKQIDHLERKHMGSYVGNSI